MVIFTPNTVISSTDVNGNLDELKTKTDYLSAPDSAWTAPSLSNSWVNYGAPFNSAGYRKDALGYVHIRGLLKNGTFGTTIFTLPVGYRPEGQELMACSVNANVFGRIDITTAGVVSATTPTGNNGYLSIDNLRFKAYA